jgi:Tol biopolymer transport system component
VGETTSHVRASVLKDEPDFDALPENTSPRVRRLLRRCLRKKPRERLQAIGDARIVLEEVIAAPDEAPPQQAAVAPSGALRLWRLLAVAAAAVAIGAVAVAWWMTRAPAPSTSPRTLSELGFPTEMMIRSVALSPDGSRLAVVCRNGSEAAWRIWVRNLGSKDVRALQGTESAILPFWSPDGRSIGFFADGQLKRVDLEGGQPIRLVAVDSPCGGSWGREGILYCQGSAKGGLMRIPSTGGTAVEVKPHTTEETRMYPRFVEDGPRFTYLAFPRGAAQEASHLRMASLDGASDREVMATESFVAYSEGRLYYLRGSTLLSKELDPSTGAVGSGDAELVVEGVESWNGGVFSLARGFLVFLEQGERRGSRITVYGRDGKVLDTIDSDRFLDDLTISRDGRRAAVMKSSTGGQSGQTDDVWVLDLERKMFSRATFGEEDDDPAFSPDGARIAFAHGGDLYVRTTNGSGEPKRLVDTDADIVVCDWTRDGWIVYTDVDSGADDMFAVPETGGKPRRLTTTPFRELTPQVSPDGRWMAYTSNEGGEAQVYVTRWPSVEGKWQVSKESAAMPRWSGDGRSLYFMSQDRRIFRATIGPGGAEPVLGLPKELFRTNYDGSYTARNSRWTVLPDGSRFLVLETPPGKAVRTSALMLLTHPSAPSSQR